MSSTPTSRRFAVLTDLGEPSINETSRRADLEYDQFPSNRPSLGKRASRALARFLVTFCIGVAATLAWLSYGDAAREMIASSSPQLGWLAPQAAAPQPAAPAAPPADQQQLNAISFGLAAVRQSVDQLAAQLAAGQEQMTREITMLRMRGEGPARDSVRCLLDEAGYAMAQRVDLKDEADFQALR